MATPCLSFDPAQAGPNIDPWYHDVPTRILRRRLCGGATSPTISAKCRSVIVTKGTHVTGQHNLKVGLQWTFGPEN